MKPENERPAIAGPPVGHGEVIDPHAMPQNWQLTDSNEAETDAKGDPILARRNTGHYMTVSREPNAGVSEPLHAASIYDPYGQRQYLHLVSPGYNPRQVASYMTNQMENEWVPVMGDAPTPITVQPKSGESSSPSRQLFALDESGKPIRTAGDYMDYMARQQAKKTNKSAGLSQKRRVRI